MNIDQLKNYSPFSRLYKENLSYLIRASNVPINKVGKLFPNDYYTGLEIESEGVRFSDDKLLRLKDWRIIGDGSLRGAYGAEMISYPYYGKDLARAIRSYCEVVGVSKKPFSFRCSTHVHVDLLHMHLPHVAALIVVSLMGDNYLFSLGADGRRNNYNCRPASLLIDEVELLGQLAGALMVHPEKGLSGYDPGDHRRYMATNWAAMFKFGTVEFRHFPGSAKKAQLIQWVRACHYMRAAAENLKTVDNALEMSLADPHEFGEFTFGSLWNKMQYKNHESDWRETQNLLQSFSMCYREVQENMGKETLDSMLGKTYAF